MSSAKTSIFLELALLTLAYVLCGIFGPWWSFAVPALLYGFYHTCEVNTGRRFIGLGVAVLAALTWLAPAVARDAVDGFRISRRVGRVLMLPGLPALLVYAISLLLAGLLAWLAWSTGSSFRASWRRIRSHQPEVKTPAD